MDRITGRDYIAKQYFHILTKPNSCFPTMGKQKCNPVSCQYKSWAKYQLCAFIEPSFSAPKRFNAKKSTINFGNYTMPNKGEFSLCASEVLLTVPGTKVLIDAYFIMRLWK